MLRLWILTLWLALWPNSPMPSVIAPKGGPVWGYLEYHANGPVIGQVPPGDSQAKRLNLSYLLGMRTTNYFHATPSQEKNIELAASRLNGVVVKPGQVFSYYAVVGPYTASNGYGWGRAFVGERIVPSVGGGVCQGSSTLYAAVLRTGLPVVERHQHGLTVPYLPPGEDATVASDYLNFRFRNNRTSPVVITAAAGRRHLAVALWGATPGPQIAVHHKILAKYPFRTITQINRKLNPGETKVLAPGQDGVKVQSWLEIQTPEGIRIQPLGTDQYRASPRLIEVNPAP